ncbi:hypothetical protein GF325_14930 [Candidatus Bathyarchaeota archaeon]|nr:hypothetical protein [Candidatus Bathyarchaeota archaeon]
MPTHRVTFLTDCPEDCKDYPIRCPDCLKDRMSKSGIPFRNIQVVQIKESESSIEASRDISYRKYLDVLNIKSVLVLDHTGICLYNYPVTGAEMDGNLVAGFIQANLAFSKEGVAKGMNQPSPASNQEPRLDFAPIKEQPVLAFNNPTTSQEAKEDPAEIYELNYKDFVLAVHESTLVRSVLILDKPPSHNLTNNLVEFSREFERVYGEVLDNFFGDITLFTDAKVIIEHVFETDLLYPYGVKIISPIEEEDLDDLQRMVYRYGLDYSRNKGFFFISTILDGITQAIQKPSKDIVHAIYMLLERNYFVPQEIELAAKYRQEKDEWMRQAEERNFAFAAFHENNEKEVEALKKSLEFTSEREGKNLIKKHVNLAQSSWDFGIFDDAMYNYKLAKIIAENLGLRKDADRIEKKMDELFNSVRQLEYDNAMKIAVSAEKNKEYLKAIQNYTLCKEMLLRVFNYEKDNKRVQQIEKRIMNLQGKIR